MAKKNIKTASKLKNARAFLDAGRLNEAYDLYSSVTEIDPRDAEAWYTAGVIAGMQKRGSDAVRLLEKAVQLRPEHELSQYNLGISCRDAGDYEKAEACFKACVRINPKYAQAYNSLAHVQIGLKRFAEAADTFRHLIALEPSIAENRNNLGTVLQAMGKLDEAIEQYKEALRLKPAMTMAWDSLGSAYTSSGRFDQAMEAYRQSLKIDPKNARAHSNLLLTLNYMDDVTPDQAFAEHQLWGQQHGLVSNLKPVEIDKNADHRLRIGYVSPDFREHSVSYFIEPVLYAHNREKFSIYCYSSVPRGDAVTDRLKGLVENWRDISNQPAAQITEQIRRDRIDILLDLSGHTACNHLDVFKYKPAPVQATWMGYPNTTGMPTMDYRITDAITDPDEYNGYYTEKLIRLPGCFLCYQPPVHAPDVAALPYEQNGFITLGSFNNLAKISMGVIRLWGRVLQTVPRARLLLKNPSLTDEATRQRYFDYLLQAGASAEQLELIGHTPTTFAHLELYNRVDLALDTFPYNGTTTTCEALWMGVPVLALKGNRHASRVSASILAAAGLEEFVCTDEAALINKIGAMVDSPQALSVLRHGLREQLKNSRLTQASPFIEGLESAYHQMFDVTG